MGKGYNVKVYDKNVNLSKLTGKNKEFLYEKLPHINDILVNEIDDLVKNIDCVIISNKDKEVETLLTKNIEIIDLARIRKDVDDVDNYEGLCW